MKIAESYRTVLPLFEGHHRGLILGMIFLVLTNVFTFLSPWILKVAIDDLQVSIGVSRLLTYCGLILVAALLQGFFRFAMRSRIIGISRHVEYRLRNMVFRHILDLPASFFQGMRTGDIMSRSTSDIEAVRMAVGPGVMHMANTTVTFVVALASMLSLHRGLTLLAFIPMPLVAFLMYYSARFYHRRFLAVQEQRAWLNTCVQENFSGIRVIKAYNQEAFQRERFAEANREYMRRNIALARSLGFFHPLVGAVAGTGTLIVLWAGGRHIINGEISLGTLVAFMGFLALLIWPTIALGWVVTLVQRGSAAAGRINEILSAEPDVRDHPEAEALEEKRGGAVVEARGLSFAYPGREEVLSDISFSIRGGEKVALVGRTGAGKSTLLNLIPRLWRVKDGTLFIDGQDVNRLRLKNLRGMMGFVPQETFLFTESLEKNIALDESSGDNVDLREVEEAARVAQLTADIIDFPETYRTVVGERGITLSGGQKQRTAIARALLRHPRLLILDDALSAVDAQTEEKVLDGIFAENAEQTVIFVSHRLSTIMRAERILVLDEGRLVESGLHDELIRIEGGVYRHMVDRQLLAEDLEREGA